MASVIWVKQSKGLATKFDPARILYDPKTGVVLLAEAYNVDFDFTGAIFRRKGFEASSVTGNCHSFFWGGSDCLFQKDGSLYKLAEDMTVTGIRSGLAAERRISYAQVGDMITYMNGLESGIVRNSISYAYTKPSKTYYPDQTREYNDPPIGSIVRSFAGRIWIAVGSTLFYSEPFAPNLFRLSANYIPFPAKIVMIAPVLSGIFVSTTNRLYFLAGTNPMEFMQTVVGQYPAIEGTDVEVDGIAVDSGKVSPLPMQMFTTTQGICVGTAEGKLVNLTYDTFEYPPSIRGSAVYTGTKYITCLGIGTDKLTLCLSLARVAPSQYAGFNFEGMCKFEDKIVGGNTVGLYTLLGSINDDAGTNIDAHFRTGPTDFGLEQEKRVRKIYLSMRSSGRLEIGISADDKGDIVRGITPYDNRLKIIHQEISGGRDIRGKHLDLKVSNIEGSDFTITGIQTVLIVVGTKTTEVM